MGLFIHDVLSHMIGAPWHIPDIILWPCVDTKDDWCGLLGPLEDDW